MKAVAIMIVAAAGGARAEPHAYVQADLLLGSAEPLDTAALMFALEQGAHLAGPVWEHAAFLYGSSRECLLFPNDTCAAHVWQARAGVEARRCTQLGGACGVLGVDLGAQYGRSSFDSIPDPPYKELVAVPRVALDAGEKNARFRLGIELSEELLGQRYNDHVVRRMAELALVLGTAVQW